VNDRKAGIFFDDFRLGIGSQTGGFSLIGQRLGSWNLFGKAHGDCSGTTGGMADSGGKADGD
jgi:hypothetical protein